TDGVAAFNLGIRYPTDQLTITPNDIQLSQELIDLGFTNPFGVTVDETAGLIKFGVINGNVPQGATPTVATLNFSVPQGATSGEVTIDLSEDPTETVLFDQSSTRLTLTAVDGNITINETDNNNTPPTFTGNTTFSVVENNTTVGTITVEDSENNDLSFSISGGADQELFTINSNTGELSFEQAPDFEIPTDDDTDNSYQIQVAVSDGSETVFQDLTVNVSNDISPAVFDTVQSQNGIFALNGEDSTNIRFTLVNNDTENVNEVGVFAVDDQQGNVDGFAPGSEGYLKAALQRSQVIFSAIADRPAGFDLEDIESVLEVDGDARLGFYLVSNGTTDTALAELEASGTTNLPIFFSDSSNLQIADLDGNGFNLNWSDQIGGSDFNDMELSVQLTQNIPTLGTNLQGQPNKELIDLSNQTGEVSVSVEVHREAAFDSVIGFYQVADSNGGIDTNSDGVVDFNPGDTGYTQAALTNRVTGLDLLKTDNQQTTTFDGTMTGGSILASFIVVDGTVDEALNNDAEVYFSFLGANSDGV
ncbi:MAG: cadherin repeat domain-containing protein, partial [Cyanobacteria bacterium P01_D01_bin.116]